MSASHTPVTRSSGHPITQSPAAFLLSLIAPYRTRLSLGLFILSLSTAAMIAIPQVLKGMFDHALLVGDKTRLAHLALGMVALSLFLAAGVLARSQLVQLTATKVAIDLRKKLVEKLLQLDVGWFERQLSGELVSRLAADVGQLRDFVNLALSQALRGTLLTLGSLAALLYTSPALTGILVLAALPLMVAGRYLGARIRVLNREQQARLATFSGALAEQVSQPSLIRSFGQEATVKTRMDHLLASILENSRIQLFTISGFVALNVLVGFTALIGVVWLGGLKVIDHTMTLGTMMAFLLYLGLLVDGVNNLSNFYPAWQGILGALDRVIDILHEQPKLIAPSDELAAPALIAPSDEGTSPSRPANPGLDPGETVGARRAIPLPPAKTGRAVRFENVTYAYPTRPETPVLHALSLTIPAGAQVAFVGPSGAGKSTLFRLLQRLDDPRHGTLSLDGINLRDLSFSTLRRQFAVVAQDAPLFAASVRDNVAFGKPDATDAEVQKALETANAADFVSQLPQGEKTPVGERGVQLSGGQRQRLAIARAVLVDAPVLLLDEATSHLDTDSEHLVQQALARAGQGRTVITIAHRLSTVQNADTIFVLDNGRLAAHGTHAHLLKTSPLYQSLYRAET